MNQNFCRKLSSITISLLLIQLGFEVHADLLNCARKIEGRDRIISHAEHFFPQLRQIQFWKNSDISAGYFDQKLEDLFDTASPAELRASLKIRLKSREFREALDAWISRSFKSRIGSQRDLRNFNTVLVGGGPHTLTFVLNQSLNQRRQTVVVERDQIGSNFYRKSFRLNSIEAYDGNDIPGGLFQYSDFDSIAGVPIAHDFGILIRLNMRASGVQVAENIEYVGLQDVKAPPQLMAKFYDWETDAAFVSSFSRIGIATGIDVPSFKGLESSRPLIDKQLSQAEGVQTLRETGGLMTGHQFLQLAFQDDSQIEAETYAIVGAHHTAFTVAEEILSSQPHARITMFGLKSRSSQEFRKEIVPPKGSDKFKKMIRDRYFSGPIPAAIDDGRLFGIADRVTKISQQLPHQFLIGSRASVRPYPYRWVILCTGDDREAGLWADAKRALSLVRYPWIEKTVSDEYGRSLGRILYYPRWPQGSPIVFTFGPKAKLPISSAEIEVADIGNPDSLYLTLDRTRRLAQRLDGWPK